MSVSEMARAKGASPTAEPDKVSEPIQRTQQALDQTNADTSTEENRSVAKTGAPEVDGDTAQSSADGSEWAEVAASAGGVRRKLVKEGNGNKPTYGHRVTVKYTGRIQSTGEIFHEDQTVTFYVGEGEVVLGLEYVVREMSEGESCVTRMIGRYGYGSRGLLERVPPDTDLEYDVELLSIGPTLKKPLDQTTREKLDAVLHKKNAGNRAFKDQDWGRAWKMYTKALDISEENARDLQDENSLAELRKVRIDCANNKVVALLKLGKDAEAKQACIQVLKMDINNIKALTRVGQICIKSEEFEEADAVLGKALGLEPTNETLLKQQKLLQQKKKAYRARQRKLFGGKLANAVASPASDSAATSSAAKAASSSSDSPAAVATTTDGVAGSPTARADSKINTEKREKKVAGKQKSAGEEEEEDTFLDHAAPWIMGTLLLGSVVLVARYLMKPSSS